MRRETHRNDTARFGVHLPNVQTSARIESDSLDDLLNKAFELAYFILGERRSSIYVAMTAYDKLETALNNQTKRLYYKPTGRATYPAARTKINLSELQLLQRLIYVECELFERLIEGEQEPSQTDLIIRYIKHLVRITTRHNSFYVTLALCRLLYNYSTPDTAEVYNLVVQNPERIRDDAYYRSRKQRLMQDVTSRFGDFVQTYRGFRGEERFQAQQNPQQYESLVRQSLNRFTPWQSPCVLREDVDATGRVIPALLFESEDPDREHEIELNRIHTIIHPVCFERVIRTIGLEPTQRRLELPAFLTSNNQVPPIDDRLNPQGLTNRELDTIKKYLEQNSMKRKQFAGGPTALVIDGRRHRSFELSPAASVDLRVDGAPELIELRSVCGDFEPNDICLAVFLLQHGDFGISPVEQVAAPSQHQLIRFAATTTTIRSDESYMTHLSITHEEKQHVPPVYKLLAPLSYWRRHFAEFSKTPILSIPKLAIATLILIVALAGAWFFFSSRSSSNMSPIAKLEPTTNQPAPDSGRIFTTPSIETPPNTARPGKGKHSAERLKQPSKIIPRGTTPQPTIEDLLAVKSVYVDSLGDSAYSIDFRDKLMSAIRADGRLKVIDNKTADAIFRGSAEQVGSHSRVVLELVDSRGNILWSITTTRKRKLLPLDPAQASAEILARFKSAVGMRQPR